MDLESRVDAQDHQALRLWLRMLTCTQLIEQAIRKRLRSGYDSTLPRFDLLAQLDRVPDGLRMGELSRRLMVTGGNVTALVEQLQADGMLERRPDPADKRAALICLTPRGRREFRRMARDHETWLIELFDGLTESEMSQLHDALGHLKPLLRQKTQDRLETS